VKEILGISRSDVDIECIWINTKSKKKNRYFEIEITIVDLSERDLTELSLEINW